MRSIKLLVALSILSLSSCKTGEGGSSSAAKDISVESKDANLQYVFKIKRSNIVYQACPVVADGAAAQACTETKTMLFSQFNPMWDKAFLKGQVRALSAGETRSKNAVERRLRAPTTTAYDNELDNASVRMKPWIDAIPVAMGLDIAIGSEETSQSSDCARLQRMACIEGDPTTGCQALKRSDNSLFAKAEPSLGWCGPRVRLLQKICAAGKNPDDFSVYCYQSTNPPPARPNRAAIPECAMSFPRCIVAGRPATCEASPKNKPDFSALINKTKNVCAPHVHAQDALCNHGVNPNKFNVKCVEDGQDECTNDVSAMMCAPGTQPNTDGCPDGKAKGCRSVANDNFESPIVAESYSKTAINGGINPSISGYKISAKVMLGTNSCMAMGFEASLKIDTIGLPSVDGPNMTVITPVKRATSTDAAARMCTAEYRPVWKTVSVDVRFNARSDTVKLRNYKELGKEEIISQP